MRTIDRRVPVRTCVGCRTRRPAPELVRVTRTDAGVRLDGPSSGRGAWLCRDDGDRVVGRCVERALRSGAFARAWRAALGPEVENLLRTFVDDEGMTVGKG